MKRIGLCLVSLILSLSASEFVVSDISYQESTDFFLNPEQGFYDSIHTECGLTGCDADLEVSSQQSIVHLRVSLADFTKANNGVQDYDLTPEMITSLGNILDYYRSHNKNVILRFAYDDFEGVGNLEPETIDQVLDHIKQMQPIFEEYEDAIMTIESSLIGKWGEQHGSDIVTFDNVAKIVDTYLSVVPTSRTILVRRPSYYAHWKKINYNNLYLDESSEEDDSYRVGVYNDGYLGSESDTGTFIEHPTLGWRNNEITWLSNHATHTFYGGEVVSDRSQTGIQYNTAEYMIEEMFITHTTYLNIGWNDEVIDTWRDTPYTGDEEAYVGKSSLDYITNHLGYRFVLRNSEIVASVTEEDELQLRGTIENVGSSNVINEKEATLILKRGNLTFEVPLEFDIRDILSRQTYEYNFTVELPEEVTEGNYEVYLHVSTISDDELYSEQNAIRFANEDIWNEDIYANYLGTVQVEARQGLTISISIPILLLGVGVCLCVASIVLSIATKKKDDKDTKTSKKKTKKNK